MRPTARLDHRLIEALQELVAHDQLSLDLCELAGQSQSRPSCDPMRIGRLRDDYLRHVKSLQLLLESHHIESQPHAFRLAAGWDLATGGPAVLKALYVNSMCARARYHRLLACEELPVQVRGVLAGNLANVRYHSAWLRKAVRSCPADLRGSPVLMRVSGLL